jgi:hypothetical protein
VGLADDSISTLLTLAGREDQGDGQTFESIILDQIEKIRETLGDAPSVSVSSKDTKSGGSSGRYMRDDQDMSAFRETCVVGAEGDLKCLVKGDDRIRSGGF